MSSAELSAWVGSIATVLAVLVALFKEDIVAFWRRPKLQVQLRLKPPDCHKTRMLWSGPNGSGVADCYYFRLWVSNQGSRRATQVQVFAKQLLRRHADGAFRQVDSFLPMNLRWAHGQQRPDGPEVFAEGISREMGKHCDLGFILDPSHRRQLGIDLSAVPEDQTVLSLDLEVKPNTGSHLVPPGVYRLVVEVAAANARPTKATIEMNHTGKWYGDEQKMLEDGIGVQIV